MEWGELYGLVICETGWTWEYVDERMTLPRLRDFIDHWKNAPPLRVALGAVLGAGKKEKLVTANTPKGTDSEMAAMIDELGSMGIPLEVRRNGGREPG